MKKGKGSFRGGIKQVALTCPNPDCGKSNPSKANFCKDCGWPLAGVIQPWIRYLEEYVDDRIEKTEINAQKVENEVRDKVINQIIKIAIWVTGVFGAAGVVLIGGMLFFGIEKISSIDDKVKEVVSRINKKVEIAENKIEKTTKRFEGKFDEYDEEIQKELRKIKKMGKRSDDLLSFARSLPYLARIREGFDIYLVSLGFSTAKPAKTVGVSPSRSVAPNGAPGSKGGVVLTAQTGGGVVSAAQTGFLSQQSSDMPLKELAFSSLMNGLSLNKVDKDNIRELALGGDFPVKAQRGARKLLAIMNGLSIYFPSSFQKRPTFRYLEDDTVNLEKSTDEGLSKDAKPDPGKVRKRRAESWAKLFWAIRSADQMDENIADRLFAKAWLSRELSDGLKGAGEKFVALLRKSSSLTAGQKKQVSKILDDHGFKRGGG